MPGFRVEGYRDAIQACREIVSRVGNAMSVPVVSIDWQPTDDQLTEDRLLPNAEGYRAFAGAISDSLIGPGSCEQIPTGLPELIAAKNELFFHRYRPQNETYLFLFRKREQGNNAVEVPQFDPLVEKADQQIWAAAGRE